MDSVVTLVERYASFDGLATEWRLTVGQPFKLASGAEG